MAARTGSFGMYLYSIHQSASEPEYQTSAVPELNGLFIFSRCGSVLEGSSLCTEEMNWFSGLVDNRRFGRCNFGWRNFEQGRYELG